MSGSAERLTGASALKELVSLRERLFVQVAPRMQFPEPDLTLDLESRRDSELRMFKYLHQSSWMHREHFCHANRIKHLYLIDAYLDLARSQNGLALYLVARSMFELSSFLHEVRTQLLDAEARDGKNWRQAGEMFFGRIVRARYATTRHDYEAALLGAGLSPERIKPFNIKNCIHGLAQDAGNDDAEVRYATLCDFVHHNLASTTTANAGRAVADMARSSGGGAMIMPGGGIITQYEYPIPSRFAVALEDTCAGFLHDAGACIRWTNEMPESPYPPKLVEQFTGTPLGVQMLGPPVQRSYHRNVGRNEPCPCGSGMKYKRCCGSPGVSG